MTGTNSTRSAVMTLAGFNERRGDEVDTSGPYPRAAPTRQRTVVGPRDARHPTLVTLQLASVVQVTFTGPS